MSIFSFTGKLAALALGAGFLALPAHAQTVQSAPQSAKAQAEAKGAVAWIDSMTGTHLLEYGGNWYCAIGQDGRFGCDTMQKAPGLSIFLGPNHTLSVGVLFAFGPGTPHDTQVETLTFPSGYTLSFGKTPFHVLANNEIQPFVQALLTNKNVVIHTKGGTTWPISLDGVGQAVEAARFYVREHNIAAPKAFVDDARLQVDAQNHRVTVAH